MANKQQFTDLLDSAISSPPLKQKRRSSGGYSGKKTRQRTSTNARGVSPKAYGY